MAEGGTGRREEARVGAVVRHAVDGELLGVQRDDGDGAGEDGLHEALLQVLEAEVARVLGDERGGLEEEEACERNIVFGRISSPSFLLP